MRNIKRLRIEVSGIVQGVGFRPHVQRLAARRRLAGWARNTGGALEMEVQGAAESCLAFLEDLVRQAPPPARVHRLNVEEISVNRREEAFTILGSRMMSAQTRFVPVDIGICGECRRELGDSRNRRYRYPFTNCCACGPRYTIIEKLPYDRERTSMRPFHLCLDCGFEYVNESDRRFHAEPNACPECGPQHTYIDAKGSVTGRPAVAAAAARLGEGKVVAVKGVGGVHLVCLADDPRPIDKIRKIKGRPDKPFAVMVPDAGEAAAIGKLTAAEADLLRGPERPIVLIEQVKGRLADNVSGGLGTVGVMLPYAPVHILLLCETRRPLVMTSANQSDAPIIIDNNEALTQLRDVADAWLLHDRRIVNGCDDSVMRHKAGRAMTLRSGRGKAPAALRLPGDYPSLLACGSDLKSTVCLAAGGWAHVSQYLGDLAGSDCLERFNATVSRLAGLLNIQPKQVVCDDHPDYISTAYARDSGLPVRRVQHHHAHIVAALVEKEIDGPVIGVAFDGAGWGRDGRIWGGEWLVCDRRQAVRSAHLREAPMAGGDAAARQPWRMAVGYMGALGLSPSEIAAALAGIDIGEVRPLTKQISAGINAPLTSSAGRLFEAAASIISNQHRQSYEGQAASHLESLASASRESGAYTFGLTEIRDVIEIDYARMFRELLGDRAAGAPPAVMAARFHRGLAKLICLVSRRLRDKEGIETVVLAGGVFVNGYLFSAAVRELEAAGFLVVANEHVPINDGGISLGQAAIAAAGGGIAD